MVCAKGSGRGREGCDDIWQLSALPAAGWTAGAISLPHSPGWQHLLLSPSGRDTILQPCSTPARGQSLSCTPCQRRLGLPWMHPQELQGAQSPPVMGSPWCLPKAQPGQHLAALQPHSQHLLFPSLELLTPLQAQPLLSLSHQPDKLHGDITGGQSLPAECRVAVTQRQDSPDL